MKKNVVTETVKAFDYHEYKEGERLHRLTMLDMKETAARFAQVFELHFALRNSFEFGTPSYKHYSKKMEINHSEWCEFNTNWSAIYDARYYTHKISEDVEWILDLLFIETNCLSTLQKFMDKNCNNPNISDRSFNRAFTLWCTHYEAKQKLEDVYYGIIL